MKAFIDTILFLKQETQHLDVLNIYTKGIDRAKRLIFCNIRLDNVQVDHSVFLHSAVIHIIHYTAGKRELIGEMPKYDLESLIL